ncbi:30S ribosomal protein S20 [Rossellomorea aquimaris]|uniref:30S ribosomal protein S20 n=1 Tax=Rossellomorea aquimaris TaxID=189382 RepID=UPI0007D08429|nr:30S ribosomal protein S20 [Rossellomorea aquimaris]
MPNIKSAIKRVKTSNERNAQNAAVKSSMRTAVKKAEAAAANSEDNVKELVNEAVRQLDKAAQKGLIHKNVADRQKSRLMKKAN